MKTMKIAFACLAGIAGLSCHQGPKETKDQESEFRYLVEEFADIKIIRYQVPGWDDLSLQQKTFIYYMGEAAKCGRDIFWNQNFKHNLQVRKCLEAILESYTGNRETPEFQDFLVYAKRVFFSNGIHHHYAEEKILPSCSADYMKQLLENSDVTADIDSMVEIMCNPTLYKMRKSMSKEGDLLLTSSTNFYDGVNRMQAEEFYAAMEDTSDRRPVEYGLNSRLVWKDGTILEETYKADGLYGPAIRKICHWLEKAAGVAESPEQASYIKTLIDYYQTGDLALWDAFNVAWVQDNDTFTDFINGFIEVYGDPLGRKGSWEGNVYFTDKDASRRTTIISQNAQWFEDNSPVDPRFKKEQVTGVSAKVINVAMLGGDSYPSTPIGINLPNSDWIRKEYGSKSVTIANITNAYDKAAQESPRNMLDEFSWDEREVALVKQYGTMTGDLHTDLHECLGHGSGQLLPGVSSGALGEYSSTLEEARADLFALYYLADPRLIELGILTDPEAYKAEYVNYIRNGLFTQLVRIEPGRNITQAHMQCRQLIASWALQNGNAIERKIRDGKTYFVINDFGELRQLFATLLEQMQRIKSEGDYQAGKALVEQYAIQVDRELHSEVLERYAALELKPYGGFLNPIINPVYNRKGEIKDLKLEYAEDFLQQQLSYGKAYNFL
ncbi:MAG: dihydrofolate reductase [Bacteroidales bacterium]|nr:dihydrofolate reductase [Bacteroidales bacterium]MDD4030561.1 dihydrofolate reductase [Bacteroidales bacterium]MDD4435292.1 dihydrofolate reductase [Bacteroidales bacterium]MDD5733337.1 dihydrofolate reductase [Bacteroidales bacterium]